MVLCYNVFLAFFSLNKLIQLLHLTWHIPTICTFLSAELSFLKIKHLVHVYSALFYLSYFFSSSTSFLKLRIFHLLSPLNLSDLCLQFLLTFLSILAVAIPITLPLKTSLEASHKSWDEIKSLKHLSLLYTPANQF